jgi:hypothetical protein
MRNARWALFLLLLLTLSCSKPAPVWIAAGHKQLENFKTDFLTGESPLVTEAHFRKAVEEIKKGGDLDLLGRAWLTRMALQVACLEEIEGGEYAKIEAAMPVPANRAYHLFLTGNLAAVDAEQLNKEYRPILAALRNGDAAEATSTTGEIEAPLSRLIAAGLAVRQNLMTEAILLNAAEAASQNGWKKALMAWLNRLRAFYEQAGDGQKAASIRQRIDLISK